MATFRELQDRVLDGSKRAGLTDLTEIKSLINQVYREMSSLTRPLIVQSTQTLVVNDGDYSLSGDWSLNDVQAIRDIRIVDSVTAQTYLLERVSPQYLLMLRQTQSTSGGQMNLYAVEGLDSVTFYPAPSSTTTQMTISFVQRPALLVVDGDEPAGIPEEFHDTIVLGAIARAVRIWNPMYARDYHGYYRQGIAEYRQWLNRYGGAWNAKAIVRGSRSNTAFHDNSRDYSGMR